MRVAISDLMDSSGVRFGTSGVRGLASEMTDLVCYAVTVAFLRHLAREGELSERDRRFAIGGDLRPSTERILEAIAAAALDEGRTPVYCGRLPSPALALWGIRERIPSAMVTGSHIPEDRNGIKYAKPGGEILKSDEEAIRAEVVEVPDRFGANGALRERPVLGPADPAARDAYGARWLRGFPRDFLRGFRLGFYEHSSAGRDLLPEVYAALGAEVVRLGRSDRFVPVDTEALRAEDVELARAWAAENRADAILSADGDADRPLVADERGRWLRGDVAGILCARYLGAEVVVAPVSCNTALERSGWFREVRRTRIGSPYVVEEMLRAAAAGRSPVVGYEANGGFLTATPISAPAGILEPLPTRDAAIVHLALIGLSKREKKPLSALLDGLPRRHTASDRAAPFPQEEARARIAALSRGGRRAVEESFPELGAVASIDETDGLRATFSGGEILHLRPSGNAPECRVYAEADSEARAREIVRVGLRVVESWRAR
ncbi:MAG: phosphomannomutase [Planctomycetota bacterium]